MGATIRSGERGANLDSQSGSNQEVVSDAELDENEIKEIRKRLRKDLNESPSVNMEIGQVLVCPNKMPQKIDMLKRVQFFWPRN